jgi:hypothetical protein
MPKVGETKGELRFSERINVPVTKAHFEALLRRARRFGVTHTEAARRILIEALKEEPQK